MSTPAKHLETVWIERERKLRQIAEDAMKSGEGDRYARYSARADAVKQCRLDLQWEFELTMRVGTGPMTDAESDAYLDQEIAAAKELGKDAFDVQIETDIKSGKMDEIYRKLKEEK